jgi:LPS-assembly lipoprotein
MSLLSALLSFRRKPEPSDLERRCHFAPEAKPLGPGLRRGDEPIGRTRRARLLAALALACALASCGFHLRGSQELPFETIYLGFSPNSPFGAQLARNIRTGTSTRVVTEPAKAQAILEVVGESRDREIVAVNAQGRAREFSLRLGLTFRLHDGKGRELIAPTRITAQRDISFNEEQVLAKESEEALLFRDMQGDLVQQLLRRLASARTDATQN